MKTNKIKKVLIAMDYDETSQKVAEQGFSMAQAINAETILLHVISEQPVYYSGYAYMLELRVDFNDNLKDSTQKFLDKTKKHLENESIKTIIKESEFRLKEKGSLFISLSFPVKSEEEAESHLNSIRKKYYDAAHHCYSYKLNDGSFKYSDAGEPNGTAGIRIYNAQNHFELTSIITVVVRYFGGIKLGVGPLGKTYYEAVYQNLKISEIEERILHKHIQLIFNYDQTRSIHHLISKYHILIEESIFNPTPVMNCLIPVIQIEKFISELKENYNCNIKVILSDEYKFIKR